MQLFFVPQMTVGLVDLPAEEARHAVQVLRKRVGDTLDIVDGRGGWFRAMIVATGKRVCSVEVEKLRQEQRRANYRLIMAVSPTKSNDRFEWFLEKATEIGVDVIVPLQCTRTERPRIRHDRYEKVLVSAMKQSLQAWLPELRPFTRFEEAVAEFAKDHAAFIGWCNEEVKSPLANNYSAPTDVFMLIGPEGDFTDVEVQLARDGGVRPITLGVTRLRTETAAIVATQSIALLNQISNT